MQPGDRLYPQQNYHSSPPPTQILRHSDIPEAAATVLKKKKKHVRPSDNYRVEATLSLFA